MTSLTPVGYGKLAPILPGLRRISKSPSTRRASGTSPSHTTTATPNHAAQRLIWVVALAPHS